MSCPEKVSVVFLHNFHVFNYISVFGSGHLDASLYLYDGVLQILLHIFIRHATAMHDTNVIMTKYCYIL